MSDRDDSAWQDWVGRTERRTDTVTAAPLAALEATLDRDDAAPVAGDEVPPLWHWLYFTPLVRQSRIGDDGHAKRGGFLPPIPLPRRMWAGGRLDFRAPLRVGDEVGRVSRIAAVSSRSGRSGPLAFVTVCHEISPAGGSLAIAEEHDIVYREAAQPGAAAVPAPTARTDETFRRTVRPDPVLLFRYSALTFNGHRIHYDRSYVTGVEHYPGLIVHGPLIATLLLDLLRRERPALRVRRFEFKAVGPLFDLDAFEVCGRDDASGTVALWARGPEGRLAMQASAETA